MHSRSLLSALVLSFTAALPLTASAQVKICPLYPYGNIGGVTYYYAAKCDGVPPEPDGYISWAGPPGIMTMGCGSPGCLPGFRGGAAKGKNKNHEADDKVKADGAATYMGSLDYKEHAEFTLKKIVIDEKEYGPFDAKFEKGGKSIPIRVFPFQILPKKAADPKRSFAIALEQDPGTAIGADWPLAEIAHEEKHQVHLIIPIGDTGVLMEGQLITHK